MSRLIDADALKPDYIVGSTSTNTECHRYVSLEQIMNTPTADVRANIKGYWIKKMQITETTKYSSYNPKWYCSYCHTEYDPAIANEINFCWKCGADMREGSEDDS